MMPNGMNMDPTMIKQSMSMMKNMSDEQLQAYLATTGMNVSPQMFRQSMGMMENMDDNQMKQMAEQAKNIQKSGFLPNGRPIPNMQNATQNLNQVPQPAQTEESDENLDIIDNFKSIGNKKYSKGDYKKALHYYNQGLNEIEELIPQYLEENKSVNSLMKRQVTINLNIAMVLQKEEKWQEGIDIIDKVLKLEKRNGKAWYRRAISLQKLGNSDEALENCIEALKCTPEGKARNSMAELAQSLGGNPENIKYEAKKVTNPQPSTNNNIGNPSTTTTQASQGQASQPQQSQEEAVIQEDNQNTLNNNNTIPAPMPTLNPMNGQPMPDISQIPDSQLKQMGDMMKTDYGKQMMRNMMKTQMGMDMPDSQLDMMANMMNDPNMIKTMANMQKNNPDMFNQARMNARAAQNNPNSSIGDGDNPIRQRNAQSQNTSNANGQQQPNTAQNMPNMEEMMKNGGPGVDGLLGNKEMLNTMFTMLKSNPAMIKMMLGQLGPDHPASKYLEGKSDEQLRTMVIWLERLVKFVAFFWPVIKVIKKNFKLLAFLFIAWIIHRYIL